MSKGSVRYYDYVNHPYLRVRDALLANPDEVFRRVAAKDVGAEVALNITGVKTEFGVRTTKIMFEWSAAKNHRTLPTMAATLAIFPLSSTETQLHLEGSYTVPLEKPGDAFDTTLGHQLAEASVKRFIQEIARWLRESLAKPNLTTAAGL